MNPDHALSSCYFPEGAEQRRSLRVGVPADWGSRRGGGVGGGEGRQVKKEALGEGAAEGDLEVRMGEGRELTAGQETRLKEPRDREAGEKAGRKDSQGVQIRRKVEECPQ